MIEMFGDNLIEQDELYVATECICDDDGVHYVCPTCGKWHDTDLDALMCCIVGKDEITQHSLENKS